MNKRNLGKTGLSVSEIAFGGVEIGMPYGIGKTSRNDMLAEEEAIQLLSDAIDKGINFFDTARLYGESERIMGKAFKGKRHNLIICSKSKRFTNADGTIPPCPLLKEIIEGSLAESFQALQTDYLDVFMLHQADEAILKNEDIKRVFSDLKDEGKIRAAGVSVYTPFETKLAIDAAWDVIQLPFNLLDQRQSSYFDLAAQNGIGIVIRSALMKGLLSTKGKNLHPALQSVEQHIKRFTELPDITYQSLPLLAKRFALSFDQVSAVLVGMDHSSQLEDVLVAVESGKLNEKTLQQLIGLSYPDPDFLNLHTWSVNDWLK